MDYRKLSLGLGVFSLAIGVAELVASRRITRGLDADGHEGLVKGFGVRELAAGAGILMQPALATGIWNRVAGDVMDIIATSAAAKKSPDNKATWGALAFTLGTAVLDTVVAIGLDKQTGKTLPTHAPLPS